MPKPFAVFLITALYGAISIFLFVGLGLFRVLADAALVTGTWLAAASGGLWYFAAIIPPIWPARTIIAAAFNAAAAICAAGAASFLVPDEQLPLVRNAFGLG